MEMCVGILPTHQWHEEKFLAKSDNNLQTLEKYFFVLGISLILCYLEYNNKRHKTVLSFNSINNETISKPWFVAFADFCCVSASTMVNFNFNMSQNKKEMQQNVAPWM